MAEMTAEQRLRKITAENKDLAEKATAADRLKKSKQRFMTAVAVQGSPSRRALVDVGGGLAAQLTTELINMGFSWAAKGSTGWFARNLDLWQGVPHFLLGNVVYVAELLTRPEIKSAEDLPSGVREFLSEYTKIFATLGFSQIVRSIKVRWGDAKEDRIKMATRAGDQAAYIQQLERMVDPQQLQQLRQR